MNELQMTLNLMQICLPIRFAADIVLALLAGGCVSRCLGVRGLHGTIGESSDYWHSRAAALGEAAGRWARRALDTRGAEAIRSIMGLCQLAAKGYEVSTGKLPLDPLDKPALVAEARTAIPPSFLFPRSPHPSQAPRAHQS